MGWFSPFSSDSETSSQTDIINRNVSAQDLYGQSVVSSENVNILDGGAISGIANVAANAIEANRGIVSEAMDFGLDSNRLSLLSVGAAFEQAGNQIQRILETTTGGAPTSAPLLTRLDIQNNLVKYGAAVAVILTGLYFWKGR